MKVFLLLLLLLILSDPAVGSDAAVLTEIDKLVRLRDYSGAASRLHELLITGSPEASFRLANLYRSGKGVSRDLEKSRELYRKAALAGHAQSQFVLARLTEKSYGLAEARKWYRMAAAQGHTHAASRLEQADEMVADAPGDIGRSEIFNAIQHNDVALIDTLIERSVNLDLVDAQGNTSLMAALLAGWPHLAARLIPEIRYPGQANANGNMPLQLASRRGYSGIVVALLDRGVDVDQRDARGNTALMTAIKNGHTEIAGLLLERGAKTALVNNKKQSAIDIAVAVGNAQGRVLLASHGVKPRDPVKSVAAISLTGFRAAVNKHGARYLGWPLLNIAIELGEIQVANQIIAQGPDLAATDPEGNSALQIAARNADAAHLRQLLTRGAEPNAVNNKQETALYLAVDAKCLQCVKLLIDRRADVSIGTDVGVTPLEAAIRTRQAEVARLLLAEGGDYAGIHRGLLLAMRKKLDQIASEMVERDGSLATTDANGRSVLWHSADQGLEITTTKIVGSGKIDLDRQDKNGYGAISQAIVKGHFSIVRLLADEGASMVLRTAAGNNLLLLAVLGRRPEIIEFLLARLDDVNARNNAGNTALMLAAASAQNGVVQKLIAAGADLQLRNGEDMNAFQIATESGHPDTAQLIHDNSHPLFKLFN
jgi:ankyrin repeat protein